MPAARVIFKGKVQGVYFRANTKQKAEELGIRGWVRNLKDGTVEAHFEGDETKINEIINWCAYNQPYARVSAWNVEWDDNEEGYKTFEIRR